MANENNHICNTCGSPYHGCNECNDQLTFTPWKSVCCSIECYSKYVDAVLAARGELEPVTVQTITPVVEETVEIIPDEVVAENETTEESTEIKTKRK